MLCDICHNPDCHVLILIQTFNICFPHARCSFYPLWMLVNKYLSQRFSLGKQLPLANTHELSWSPWFEMKFESSSLWSNTLRRQRQEDLGVWGWQGIHSKTLFLQTKTKQQTLPSCNWLSPLWGLGLFTVHLPPLQLQVFPDQSYLPWRKSKT